MSTPLVGCLGFGGDEATASEPVTKARAAVTSSTGGIEGVVTDNAVQPVIGITVLLVESGLEAVTADDGSFAFSNLQPGTYTLSVEAPEYVPARQTVEVRSGSIATADFILVHLASDLPYTLAQEQAGFMECGQQVGWETRPTTAPLLTPVDEQVNSTTGRNPNLANRYGVTWFFLGIATCFIPNVVFENTTNDRFIFAFDLDAPIDTLVYEMVWQPTSTMGQWLSTVVEINGFPNDDSATFYEEYTKSPAYGRIEKARFEEVATYLAQRCDGGLTAACLSPWDNGWPLQVRVFAAWQCLSETAGACAPLQQSFTHYMTAFYNGPAPEGYSAAN